ncbi:MAG TPA: DNA gyrase inhibitor YacG [Chakrabartia sp.]|nr:DNA gyrase inhibitor YacG [Chakrabartia sp.]
MADLRCPLCRQPSAPEHKPFCSRGCKDRDLINWLDGSYAVPGHVNDEDDGTGLDSTPEA